MAEPILDPTIWHPVPIAPMPLLVDLRNTVLIRSTTRMPKWKFRVEPDVVLQIQPRPNTRTKANPGGLPWFDCQTVIRDDVTGAMLKAPPRDSWKIQFKVTISDPWFFKVTSIGGYAGLRYDEALAVRDRVIDRMPVAFTRLHPEMMLKPACLACGKALSDPISMARWIGPECAGTSSAVMPYTLILEDA